MKAAAREGLIESFEVVPEFVRFRPHLCTATRPSADRLRPPAKQLGQRLRLHSPTFDSERRHKVSRSADLSTLFASRNRFEGDAQDRTTTPDELIRLQRLTFETGAPAKLINPDRWFDRFDRAINLNAPPRKPARSLAPPLLLPPSLDRSNVHPTSSLNSVPEYGQHTIDIDQRVPHLAEQLPMASEHVVDRVVDQTCNHRVQVNVGDETIEYSGLSTSLAL